MENNTFGERLQSFRKMNCLTCQELADKVGVTKQFISYLETGKRQPSDDMVIKLAEALKVRIHTFYIPYTHTKDLEITHITFNGRTYGKQE